MSHPKRGCPLPYSTRKCIMEALKNRDSLTKISKNLNVSRLSVIRFKKEAKKQNRDVPVPKKSGGYRFRLCKIDNSTVEALDQVLSENPMFSVKKLYEYAKENNMFPTQISYSGMRYKLDKTEILKKHLKRQKEETKNILKLKNTLKCNSPHLYILSTPERSARNCYKVGTHTGTMQTLATRYRLYFPTGVQIYFFEPVDDKNCATVLENRFKKTHKQYRIKMETGNLSEWVLMSLEDVITALQKIMTEYK